MFKFVKRVILLFVTIIIIIFTLLLFLKRFSLKSLDYKLKDDVTTIILGESQTECAINDSDIPHVVNLSQSAETYLYSYAKLKIILTKNPNLKSVYLSYSYNNLVPSFEKFYTDHQFINYRLPLYFNILDGNSLRELSLLNFTSCLKTIPVILKHSLKQTFKGEHTDNIGGFLSLPVTPNKIKVEFYDTKKLSKLQLKYLIKIKNLCIKNNIKLRLISTPLFNNKHRFSKELMRKVMKFPIDNDLVFINLSNIITDEKLFYDMVHLNKYGSQKFTTIFKDYLFQNND